MIWVVLDDSARGCYARQNLSGRLERLLAREAN